MEPSRPEKSSQDEVSNNVSLVCKHLYWLASLMYDFSRANFYVPVDGYIHCTQCELFYRFSDPLCEPQLKS